MDGQTFHPARQYAAGFRLLADLSALDSMEIACAPFIGKVMDRCNERGIKKVIRVIPDP